MPLEATHNLPSTRASALALGSRRYYTGAPCAAGHVEERNASSGACLECGRKRQRTRLADPEFKARHAQWTLNRYHRKKALPGLIENIRENAAVAGQAPHRKAAQASRDAIRYADPDERQNMRNAQTLRYRRLKGDPDFRAKEIAASRLFHARHPDRTLANSRRYQAKKRGACPQWLTSEEHEQIKGFYAEARRMTKLTGVKHVVDHIVPLRGETVCGLHVPWNLQILTELENLKKGNKLCI